MFMLEHLSYALVRNTFYMLVLIHNHLKNIDLEIRVTKKKMIVNPSVHSPIGCQWPNSGQAELCVNNIDLVPGTPESELGSQKEPRIDNSSSLPVSSLHCPSHLP